MAKAKNVRVRMLRDVDYSSDGVNIVRFEIGKTYSLPKAQAQRYMDKRLAEQDKAKGRSPETK